MSVNLPLVVMVLITAALSGSSAEDPDMNNIVGSRMSGGARSSFSSGNDTECNPLREHVKFHLEDFVRNPKVLSAKGGGGYPPSP